jgi:hypothetical protein
LPVLADQGLQKYIKMNRHLSGFFLSIVFLLTITVVISGCGSSRPAAGKGGANTGTGAGSNWQRRPLTIDGSDKDWAKPLPWFDKTEQLSYSVTNDGQYVSILMSTKNPQEQQKIIQGGMTVWINTHADKTISDAKGIGYPLDKHNDRERNIMAQARPDKYKQKPVTLEDQKEYELYDFNRNKDSTIENFTYGGDNPTGIQMRMDFNETGELIYEAAIPLSAIFTGGGATAYIGKSIAVGFIIEGLPPNANVPRGQSGGPEIGVGGGLGFGSFGSGGGIGLSIGTGSLGGGRGGSNKQLFRQGQVWQVVELARH